jgi:RND family efflux transporter, MFP subunit
MTADVENQTVSRTSAPSGKAVSHRIAPRRHGMRRAIYAAGALLLLAGVGFYVYTTWFAGGNPADRYTTAPVERGDIEDSVTATGTLQPRDYVDVGTQVSGQLKIVHVQIGSTVKQGDLLAEIDPTVYRSRVDANRAQLRNQTAQLADRQAQLVLAQQQLKRQQNLMKEEATTSEALQIAEASVRSINAQIQAIRAQMQQTESTLRGDEANLGYTKIYAPMAGTVVSQTAKQGQTLNANQQAPIVLRIADLSTMTVQTQVSEADVSKLRLGMDAYFTTLGSSEGQRWYGTLRQVLPTPTITNNVVLYDALFDVPNPDQKLMTQMTAQVFFVLASAKDAVIVPIAALRPARAADGKRDGKRSERRRQGAGQSALNPGNAFAKGAMVHLVHDDGSVEERPVKVGVMNRVSAQILSGVEAGDVVAVGTKQDNTAQRAPQNGQRRMSPRI